MSLKAKPRCPDARSQHAIDDEHDEIHEGDVCKLVDKVCLLEAGEVCEVYSEFLKQSTGYFIEFIEPLTSYIPFEMKEHDWYMKQDEG